MPAASPARPGRRRGAVPAALVLAVATLAGAAGCSGGSSDGASTATTRTTTTTTTTSTATAAAGSSRDDYVRAVQAGVGTTLAKGGASDDEVACIAEVWVDVIGPDTFASKGIVADEVASPSFAYSTLGITDAQADDLLDAFGTCGVDLVGFMVDALAPLVDEQQFACVASKVSPEQGRAIGRDLLVGGADADAGVEALGAIAAECGIDLS